MSIKTFSRLSETAATVKDVRKQPITVGCTVVRPVPLNLAGSVGLKVCKVTDVKNGVVYLDNSKVGIKFPDRLAVVE